MFVNFFHDKDKIMRYDFGKVYKEIRESKGLTQEEVCGEVLSRTSLSKIESGKATPKYENMEFLLRQINMPPLSTEPTNRNHANLSQYELNPRD